MAKTIDVLVAEITIAERRLLKLIKPLRKRLKPFELFVAWDADNKEWFIYPPKSKDGIIVRFERDSRHIVICRPAASQGDSSVYLSEVRYKKLMTLPNNELAAYFKAWHRNTTKG